MDKTTPAMLRIRQREVDWLIHPDKREILPDSPNVDWFAPGLFPHAEALKLGDHRCVWRVPFANRVLIVKVQKGRGIRSRLKALLFGRPLYGEWRRLVELRNRGIPAPAPIATAMDRKQNRGLLLQEEIADARPLSSWIHLSGAPGGRTETRRIVQAVARLFALSHHRGFIHRDAHPGNIVWQSGPDQAWYLDVHGGVLHHGPVSMRVAARSMAQLAHATRRVARRADALRFLRDYLRHRASMEAAPSRERKPAVQARRRFENRGDLRAWTAEIVRATVRHAHHLARHRDRRTFREGKYFAQCSFGQGWHATVVLRRPGRFGSDPKESFQRSPDQWQAYLRDALDQWNRETSIHTDQPDELKIEVQSATSLVEKLRWTLGRSPQRRMFEHSLHLRNRDLPSRDFLAFAEQRAWGWVRRTLLVQRPRRMGP